jgi:hypothetical protein
MAKPVNNEYCVARLMARAVDAPLRQAGSGRHSKQALRRIRWLCSVVILGLC